MAWGAALPLLGEFGGERVDGQREEERAERVPLLDPRLGGELVSTEEQVRVPSVTPLSPAR